MLHHAETSFFKPTRYQIVLIDKLALLKLFDQLHRFAYVVDITAKTATDGHTVPLVIGRIVPAARVFNLAKTDAVTFTHELCGVLGCLRILVSPTISITALITLQEEKPVIMRCDQFDLRVIVTADTGHISDSIMLIAIGASVALLTLKHLDCACSSERRVVGPRCPYVIAAMLHKHLLVVSRSTITHHTTPIEARSKYVRLLKRQLWHYL